MEAPSVVKGRVRLPLLVGGRAEFTEHGRRSGRREGARREVWGGVEPVPAPPGPKLRVPRAPALISLDKRLKLW